MEKVTEMLRNDCHLTVQKTAEELTTNKGTKKSQQ
jgi:hypothetical protein